MLRALFICSRNQLRSPTAEQIFASWPGVETESAGLAPDADTPLEPEQLRWADVIFVMEKAHRRKLTQRFKAHLNGERVVCLDIAEDYSFMRPELVALLQRKVAAHLRTSA